ncbi:hypothetical protein [Absidia glauca]|uniref:Uncharacterized protein n=1 Tax=Absidia glauca TaxID=4829 RepID=A0A168PV56_ABSGL|nr:hypothetical protein [Absidia glauca]
MKFNILAISAAVLVFQQVVFAAPADTAMPVEDLATVNHDVANNEQVAAQIEDAVTMNLNAPTSANDNALEADLITHYGWDKKSTQVLTTFLDTIDRLGDMVGPENLDAKSAGLLADFQAQARQLIAQAGYEYRQLADNRRVLTRLSTSESAVHEESLIGDLLSPLLNGLKDLLTNLKKSFSGSDIISKVLNKVIDLLIKIATKLSDMLNKPKSL